MALFKILNNFNSGKSINTLTSHTPGYCYFDKNTGKFWVDTGTTAADMLQLGGTFYGTCASTGLTEAKVVNDCPGFSLYTGASIYIKFIETNLATVGNITLNVNSTGAYNIKRYGTTSINAIDAITAGLIVNFVFDGSNWVWVGQMNTDTNIVPSAYCTTTANTKDKVAECTNFALQTNSYIHISFVYSNTAQNNLTLKIGSANAKPIYINGAASNSANYTLPAGTYLAFYDGTAYQIRTDGVLPGKTADSIISISNDGSTIIYTKGDGTTGSFAVPNTSYSAGASISITNNQVINTGVRAISQGDDNGTIKVNTGGVTAGVSVKGLKSAAYSNTSDFATAAHTHGNITTGGLISNTAVAAASGDSLLIADTSGDDIIVKSNLTFDGETTSQVLTKKGTWETLSAVGGGTDTKNTAGSTDINSKIYLVGATSQTASAQTYSHDTVFVSADGDLYAPTAVEGTSTTQVATTEFVMNIVGDIATLLASV